MGCSLTPQLTLHDCLFNRDKWVKWDGNGDAPSSVSDWNGLTSAQKIEFLSLLLAEKEPLRYDVKRGC